jgi:hypothetical protein
MTDVTGWALRDVRHAASSRHLANHEEANFMRRGTLKATMAVIAVFSLTLAFAGSALAANPHIVGSLTTTSGPGSNQVTVTGKIAGLGNGYAGTALTATADVTFDVSCANPKGKLAPGQQGRTGSLNGTGAIDSVDRNGTYTFHVTFTINLTPAKAFGCPNNQWTASATNISLTLTSITLADGTVVAP